MIQVCTLMTKCLKRGPFLVILIAFSCLPLSVKLWPKRLCSWSSQCYQFRERSISWSMCQGKESSLKTNPLLMLSLIIFCLLNQKVFNTPTLSASDTYLAQIGGNFSLLLILLFSKTFSKLILTRSFCQTRPFSTTSFPGQSWSFNIAKSSTATCFHWCRTTGMML